MMRELPVLIYDGECRFCRRWIARWQEITGDRVAYRASQELDGKFSEIEAGEFEHAVQWVGEDGARLSGGAAVLATLATSTWSGAFLQALYRKLPGFAWAVECIYAHVAKRRMLFSRLTSLLWGSDVRVPQYAVSTAWFLRVLGAIYFLAFVSFWIQAEGLVGEKGIAPAGLYFERVGEALGPDGFWRLPSLLWWGAGDGALWAWCAGGAVVSLALVAGFAPLPCLVFLWAIYLSLTAAGQIFYQYQWDILLLETGFLAIFLAPWSWWLRTVRPPRLAHFLLLWLLFRLMFASGVVKLSSGDPAWADGTALTFHYFTQPLPTPLAWYAQQLPVWWQWLSLKVMFFIELVLPFFLFAPRRLRLMAIAGLVLLQVVIALTGNYGFFNLLTVALCLLAVDDAMWRRSVVSRGRYLPKAVLVPVTVVLVLLSLIPLGSSFRRPWPIPQPLLEVYDAVSPFRIVNGYGLFAKMTRERREIIVQGSEDGLNWKTYSFRYKPGDPAKAPPWVAPYMPRLDWQMWFAALERVESNPWFLGFLQRLLQGSPEVIGLLEGNPFPDGPPRYVRALSDDYTFTTWSGRKAGDWWKAEPLGVYYREVSLR